jgi:hypothetical protein
MLHSEVMVLLRRSRTSWALSRCTLAKTADLTLRASGLENKPASSIWMVHELLLQKNTGSLLNGTTAALPLLLDHHRHPLGMTNLLAPNTAKGLRVIGN